MSGVRRPRLEINDHYELVAASGAVAAATLAGASACVRWAGRTAGIRRAPFVSVASIQRPKRGGAMAGVARPPGAGARDRRSPPAWLLRERLPARPDGADRAGAEADPGGAVAADGHAVRRRV